MRRLLELRPAKLRALERRRVARRRNVLPRCRVAEPGETLEFLAPAAGDRVAERRREIAEEEERARRGELLAHEEQRDRRREQHARDRGLERRRGRERADALAERAVADLVVGLEEVDERGRRQLAAPAAARGGRDTCERSPW